MNVEVAQERVSIDEAAVEAFAGRLFDVYAGGMLTLMVDFGWRSGLFDGLAAGPGTSEDLAQRAGIAERYARECLGSLVTGGLVGYQPATETYSLPAEHALCLAVEGSSNLAPLSRITTLLAKHVDGVLDAARTGSGVPYEAFRPEFTGVMDAISRGALDGQLLDGILPLVAGLVDRLDAGIRVADVGCGTGHAVNLMAQAFPRSTFVGYDLAPDAIEAATAEAAGLGLANVSFEVLDVAALPGDPPFGAVFAFDAIHDQVDPAGVLAGVHAALVPGGTFVMLDIKASSELEGNRTNPLAPWLYGVSTLHCMTVSLAHGGAGLGTVWGEQRARALLAEAGFVGIEVLDVPDDPLDSLYVCRTPGP